MRLLLWFWRCINKLNRTVHIFQHWWCKLAVYLHPHIIRDKGFLKWAVITHLLVHVLFYVVVLQNFRCLLDLCRVCVCVCVWLFGCVLSRCGFFCTPCGTPVIHYHLTTMFNFGSGQKVYILWIWLLTCYLTVYPHPMKTTLPLCLYLLFIVCLLQAVRLNMKKIIIKN